MRLRERLDRIKNPWVGSAIVFLGMILLTALSFGLFWLATGGRERMVTPSSHSR